MGYRDWAEAELREAELAGGQKPRANIALAAFYEEAAMPWRSIRAVRRVYYTLGKNERTRLRAEVNLLSCPVPYPSLVLSECRRFGVAPHLVYAMMREESRFDDKAVSAAGAMGLMQIMPATGEQLAEELGLTEDVRGRLLAPDINVSLGVSYAARLLDRLDGDPLKMLAAYNAGPSNAARWFNDRSARKPRVEQVDGIDFWETREYVKRIVESAHLYYALYFRPWAPAAGEQPDGAARDP
jgi:soluble lytic murein transglycosylase